MHMKKVFSLICALLLWSLSAGALADGDGFWMANEDWYYHAAEACGGTAGRVPISREGAEAFGKYACPVCVQAEDDASEPRAAKRGGVTVVRFSDAWMARQELESVFGFSSGYADSGEMGQDAWLAEWLHGDAYVAFLENGGEATYFCPSILPSDIILASRRIGSAYYVAVKPEENVGAVWEMEWTVSEDRAWLRDDVLYCASERTSPASVMALNVDLPADSTPIYNRAGELPIEVYDAMDVYIAVFHELRADPNLLEEAGVRIGAVQSSLTLSGRMYNDEARYAYVLTEAELNALRNGAEVKIVHKPLAGERDYLGGEYAVAYYGTSGRAGIMDRSGNFAVEPTFEAIYRSDIYNDRTTVTPPFFCQRFDGSSVILDGETLEVIAESARGTSYENPAVYRELENAHAYSFTSPATFRSLQDGSVLFDFPGDGGYVDGRYVVLADGLPQRMIYWSGEGAQKQAVMIDNYGSAVPGAAYQRITALYWLGEKGVFLVERFAPEEYNYNSFEGGDYYAYGEVYTGKCYGAHWRCGLIDQDGNVLADLQYTSVECSVEGEIRLGAEDGSVRTLDAREIVR